MKIKKAETTFAPVSIILETVEEVTFMRYLMDRGEEQTLLDYIKHESIDDTTAKRLKIFDRMVFEKLNCV